MAALEVLLLALFVGADYPCLSQRTIEGQRRFLLSASVEDKAQLTKEDIPEASAERGVKERQNPEMKSDRPEEIGVDWSSWISRLADRWYFALKDLEERSGMQFSTRAPALIQFSCYADGQIGNIILRQTSGVPLYDQMQIEALRDVTPLPPFPLGSRRTSITLVQGWESHPRQPGEVDFTPGSFGKDFPMEKVRQWRN